MSLRRIMDGVMAETTADQVQKLCAVTPEDELQCALSKLDRIRDWFADDGDIDTFPTGALL